MLEKARIRKVGLALAAAGALCLSTWVGAEARPFGLLLGGAFHHFGGFAGGFHHFGGFGGGFPARGFDNGLRGGAFGFRQPGVGYSGSRQVGIGDRGYGSAGGTSRWESGTGRGRYWGGYGAAAAGVGAIGELGAYSSGGTTPDSDESDYLANRYFGYPGYGH